MSKITNELIQAAKAKYGQVFVLEVTNTSTPLSDLSAPLSDQNESFKDIEVAEGEFKAEKGFAYAVLQKPDKRVIGVAMTHKDPIQLGNFILKNTIIELDGQELADEAILQDDDINIAASLEVTKFIEIGTARLKKY